MTPPRPNPILPRDLTDLLDRLALRPGTTSDALLIVADALDEAAESARFNTRHQAAAALTTEAAWLRHLAPTRAAAPLVGD